ncbi:unnamed protein product [Lactuca virosa]|uniref:Phosphatidic acid phosphatase type 2/haloperoxidase domain-containing protein n=1 Tax=Lactuca virosa TaxID=75947 RepID=A0AAU9LGI7_9ASTR|nr:unnamed protein product [Lactuca virosa]
MLFAVVSILINPPPILNQFHKFDIHRKTPFSTPVFRTSKESAIGYPKPVRLKKMKVEGSIETGILNDGGDERFSPAVSALEQETLIDYGGDSFHQTVGGLHTLVNRLSKWVVAAIFGGFILLRHDALALWAAMGSILNVILSITLKQILKQERPASRVSSGHGMPSSHAQSIFYATLILILSVIRGQGLNVVTGVFSVLVVALGSYFSWLRILLRYHTTSQVVVGAIMGSIFSVLWFSAWEMIVFKAYNSILWVRILVIFGAFCFCLGFISHVLRHWMKDE